MVTHRFSVTLSLLAPVPLALATHFSAPADAATPKCKGKRATTVGTAGDDRIRGTKRADVIVGLGGNDHITGGRRPDVICGGPGDDTLSGDGGFDTLVGNGGDDVLKGGNGLLEIDRLEGGGGNDRRLGLRHGAVRHPTQAGLRIAQRPPAQRRREGRARQKC